MKTHNVMFQQSQFVRLYNIRVVGDFEDVEFTFSMNMGQILRKHAYSKNFTFYHALQHV